MSINLVGIYAAVITPFTEEWQLDKDKFQGYLKHLAGRGADGVLLSGTTGEGTSLSVDVRKEICKTAAEGNSGLHLLAGTGAANIHDVITLNRAAFDAGVDAVLIIPPFFYFDPPLEGLIYFYSEVIKRSVPADGAVLFYHNPYVGGVGVSDELINRLRDRFPDNIVGIKDSSREWEHIQDRIKNFPDLSVMVGSDALLSRALAAGGAGAVTGLAGLYPDILREIYDKHQAGELTEEAQSRIDAIPPLFEGLPRIPAIKALLHAADLISTGRMLPPLQMLSSEELGILKERFNLHLEVPSEIEIDKLFEFLE